ncbi:NUDIX domain-containing protein [Candidatus Roizmanbacteria bacterium]|nr:NUDIX domain-containing protein [Candidatus Roizmanbacteria bacterium]
MTDEKYIRKVQTSVTCFLYHGDEYLFVHRRAGKMIDPNKLNGVGGRVEPGENYLEAAIRETEEETGYQVAPEDIEFCGMVKLEGGYQENWVMAFFKMKVDSMKVPVGMKTDEGTFMWLTKEEVLNNEIELVDDLHYCFTDVVEGKEIFFMNAQVNAKEKIEKMSVSKLTK